MIEDDKIVDDEKDIPWPKILGEILKDLFWPLCIRQSSSAGVHLAQCEQQALRYHADHLYHCQCGVPIFQ